MSRLNFECGLQAARKVKGRNRMDEQREDAVACADVISILAALDSGDVVIDAGRQWQQLVTAVKRTGQKGSLTLRLEVGVAGRDKRTGFVDQISVKSSIVMKEPQEGHGSDLFFVDDKDRLTQDNPAQEHLFRQQEKRNV